MKFPHISKVFRSPTFRLAASYLAIIMVMSLFFSYVFYSTSLRQLSRHLPPPSLYLKLFTGDGEMRGEPGPPPGAKDIDRFLRERIEEGQNSLLLNLMFLNVLILFGGSIISYVLARYTLHPIENAMDAQARFVSDASHELRTPLTAIQTCNEVALRKPTLTVDDAKEIIQSNIEEVVKLKQLSDGLLALAKQDNQQFKPSPVSMQDAVSEALNVIVQLALPKNIAVIDNVPEINVLSERQGLIEVLVILLENAVKYSDNDKNIYIDGYKKGKHGFISVRDEGPGIRATDQQYVFERFYRANTARTRDLCDGYGLGLSIAQKIVERNNGSILLESTPGKGSTFTVKLPLAGL